MVVARGMTGRAAPSGAADYGGVVVNFTPGELRRLVAVKSRRYDGKHKAAQELFGLGLGTTDLAAVLQASPETVRRATREKRKRQRQEKLAAVAAAYQTGKSLRVIAQELGLDASWVLRAVKELGLPTGEERQKVWTQVRRRRAGEMREKGMGFGDIASKLGVDESTVRKWLR